MAKDNPRLTEIGNHGSNYLKIWRIDDTLHQIIDNDGTFELNLNRIKMIERFDEPERVTEIFKSFRNLDSIEMALERYDYWLEEAERAWLTENSEMLSACFGRVGIKR